MLKTGYENMKIYSLYKNDGMMNVFFLFIYHQEECNERERKYEFLVFLISDKYQYWCFLFLPQVSIPSHIELFLIKKV